MKKAFKHFIVDKNYKSTRLDRFLKKQDQNLPQSLIEKNIRKKKILVNKLKGKSSQILQEGDLVEVFFENNLICIIYFLFLHIIYLIFYKVLREK